MVKKETLHSPQVVATVTQSADLDFLSSAGALPLDILEYRLDNLLSELDRVSLQLKEPSLFPTLITVRRPDEGGANNLGDSDRLSIYRKFLEQADLFDIEISSFQSDSAYLELATEAQENDVLVIASFHDFSAFPGRAKLASTIKSGYESGADIVKLAVVVETMAELFQLVELVEEQSKEGRLISAMGMGPLGKLSRLVLASAGSCLNYGYLQSENAPGQWSAEEMKRLIVELIY